MAIWRLGKRALNPAYRALHRLEADQKGVLLQPACDTAPDRHPALFSFVRDALRDCARPRILSFGCSTGEEPIALTAYFPNAQIDAVEINPHSLAIARRNAGLAGATRIAFTCGGSPPDSEAHYDAVFCLSVLRHWRLEADLPDNCAAVLPFARFNVVVEQLDHCLKPGGMLIIWGSQFDFTSTSVADSYSPLAVQGATAHGGPVYGADNQLLRLSGHNQFVFKKQGLVAEEGLV